MGDHVRALELFYDGHIPAEIRERARALDAVSPPLYPDCPARITGLKPAGKVARIGVELFKIAQAKGSARADDVLKAEPLLTRGDLSVYGAEGVRLAARIAAAHGRTDLIPAEVMA